MYGHDFDVRVKEKFRYQLNIDDCYAFYVTVHSIKRVFIKPLYTILTVQPKIKLVFTGTEK